LNKGAVRHAPGFGFLEGITVDTHFVARGRISRLTQFLCTDHTRRGLGLGEDTAVLIQPGGLCEVIGTGVVAVLETGDSHHSNYDRIAEDELVTGEGFRLGFLAAGTVFNLRSWRIARFPEHHQHRPRLEKEELHEGLRNE
jgi:cyanophycinase